MRTIGDPSRFALEFEFVDDPDPDSPPRYRHSWGRLRIWVGGLNLSSGVTASAQVVDAIECPLLPLVEWFLERWDALFHEERLPRPDEESSSAEWYARGLGNAPADDDAFDRLVDDRLAWWSRHGLGSAIPDFRILDVHFRRRGQDIEISWSDAEWRKLPLGVQMTVQPGVAVLPPDSVCESVAAWCQEIIEFVRHRMDVRELAARLQDLRQPARTSARLLLAAGQDRLEAVARRIRDRAGLRGGELTATIERLLGISERQAGGLYARLTVPVLLYRSVQPHLTESDLDSLLRIVEDLREGTAPGFESVRQPLSCPVTPEDATRSGNELAPQLRASLQIPSGEFLTGAYDLEQVVLKTLGIEVRDETLGDRRVEGVAVWQPNHLPCVAINATGRFASTPWGRRMTLAHELCHLVSDGTSDVGVGVVSNPWAPYLQERRANAYAAMLLAPPEALSRCLDRDSLKWSRRDLRHAMYTLGIGATTLCRQLQNQKWITREESEAWMEQLASGSD